MGPSARNLTGRWFTASRVPPASRISTHGRVQAGRRHGKETPPEPGAQVRILLGAPLGSSAKWPLACGNENYTSVIFGRGMLPDAGFCRVLRPMRAPSHWSSSRCRAWSMRPIQTPLEADHAPGVDPHEHLDGVARPGGDLGGGDAGVEPPGDPGVAQVVGAFHERGGELVGGEGGGADFLPDLPPGGWLDGVAVLGPEQAAVRARAVRLDVGAEELDELRRDGDLADGSAGVRGGPALGAAFEAAVQGS